MNSDHSAFLDNVRFYVAAHPEVAAHVSDYVAAGITVALRESLERATDFEIIASVAIAKRYNQRDALILSKLKKWQGRASLMWDSTIKELEK